MRFLVALIRAWRMDKRREAKKWQGVVEALGAANVRLTISDRL